jgi:hypothetical protein
MQIPFPNPKSRASNSKQGSGVSNNAISNLRFQISPLLVAQCFHRIEPRGLDGRIDAEEKADAHGNEDSQEHGPQRHRGRQSGQEQVDEQADENAQRTPMTPPAPVSTTASVRNCQMTSRRRAPIALRTPISRVRCVTDISMMFITPTPPTSNPDRADHGGQQGHRAGDFLELVRQFPSAEDMPKFSGAE